MAKCHQRLLLCNRLDELGRGHLGATLVVSAIAAAAACQDVAVTAVPVLNVEVQPQTVTIVLGETQELSAILTDGEGNELRNRAVVWSSDDGSVAEVDSDGVVSAVGVGTTRITATSEGRTGEGTITVMPKPVGSVTIEPDELHLTERGEDRIRAIVRAEDGTELTDRGVDWASSDEDIVEVNGQGSGNLEATVRAGKCPRGEVRCTAEIMASAEDVTGTAAVTVTKAPERIVVTADRDPPYRMLPGATMQLAARVEASDETDVTEEVGIVWTSDDEEVATVDETGKVTAVGCPELMLLCPAMITAAVEGVQGVSDDIEVEVFKTATAVSISPSVVADTLDPSETVELSAKPTADDGSTDLSETRPVTWTSSAPNTAVVKPTEGVTTFVVANGPTCPVGRPVCTAGITAEVDGVSGQVDVYVRKAIATVDVEPASDTAPRFFRYEQTFTATPLAEDGTPLPDRSITWEATQPGDQDSPCGRGIGLARVTLDPTTGPSTTATVTPQLFRSLVWIWAEAAGVVGCARLQIGS